MTSSSSSLTREQYHAVYDCLLGLLKPYAIEEGLWAFLEIEDVFVGTTAPAGVLKVLRQKFSDEDLVRAGVLNRRPGQPVELAADLRDPRSYLVVVRRGERILDIIGSRGCISGLTLPLFAMTKDDVTRTAQENTESTFLVTFDTRDLVILRAIGFPATLATGLDQMSDKQLRCFASIFEPTSPFNPSWSDGQASGTGNEKYIDHDARSRREHAESAAPTSSDARPDDPQAPQEQSPDSKSIDGDATDAESPCPPKIVFVNWSMHRLSNTDREGFAAVEARFQWMAKERGFELGATDVWQPVKEELPEIRRSARTARAQVLGETLQWSIWDMARPLICPDPQMAEETESAPSPEPESVWELLENHFNVPGKPASPRPLQKKEPRPNLIYRDVIAPFLKASRAARGPIDRFRWIELGLLSDQILTVISELRRPQLPTPMVMPWARSTKPKSESFKELMQLSSRFDAIARNLY